MIKIDVKDKKILYELTQNARLSDAQLGRKVGLSKSSVRYRITRLEKLRVIEDYITVINFGPIGYDSFDFFVRFNCSQEQEEIIVEALVDKPYSLWIATLSGEWDVILEVRTNKQEHIIPIINDILKEFGQYIDTYQVQMGAEIYKVDHLVHDFPKDIYPKRRQAKSRKFEQVYELDDVEKKLLSSLSKNSRSSLQSLAKAAKVSVDVARYRIKRLEERKIIVEYIAVVSIQKLGYTEYIILLDLHNIDNTLLDKLRLQLIEHGNIKYCFRGGISPQIIMLCAFSTSDDLTHFMKSLKGEFHSIISLANHLVVKEHKKFTLFPSA